MRIEREYAGRPDPDRSHERNGSRWGPERKRSSPVANVAVPKENRTDPGPDRPGGQVGRPSTGRPVTAVREHAPLWEDAGFSIETGFGIGGGIRDCCHRLHTGRTGRGKRLPSGLNPVDPIPFRRVLVLHAERSWSHVGAGFGHRSVWRRAVFTVERSNARRSIAHRWSESDESLAALWLTVVGKRRIARRSMAHRSVSSDSGPSPSAPDSSARNALITLPSAR